MILIDIKVTADNSHYEKVVRLFGIVVFRQRERNIGNKPGKAVGFEAGAPVSGEIADDWDWEE